MADSIKEDSFGGLEGNRRKKIIQGLVWVGFFQVCPLPFAQSGHGLPGPWVNQWGTGGAAWPCHNLSIPTHPSPPRLVFSCCRVAGGWVRPWCSAGRAGEDTQAGNAPKSVWVTTLPHSWRASCLHKLQQELLLDWDKRAFLIPYSQMNLHNNL